MDDMPVAAAGRVGSSSASTAGGGGRLSEARTAGALSDKQALAPRQALPKGERSIDAVSFVARAEVRLDAGRTGDDRALMKPSLTVVRSTSLEFVVRAAGNGAGSWRVVAPRGCKASVLTIDATRSTNIRVKCVSIPDATEVRLERV
jgi:hypothetical protein